MIKLKEGGHIFLAIIVLLFTFNYLQFISRTPDYASIFLSLIGIVLVAFTSIVAKKITAYYYEITIEHKSWNFQRFGLRREAYLKTPIPIGIILAFIIPIISFGKLIWMAVLEFDAEGTSARASKRHGLFSFTEITDIHLGLIAASGVIACLALSILAYLVNFPEIARVGIYYAAFSLIPFSNLDGTKIFFASKRALLWIILASITAIFLSYSFLLI